MDSRTRPLCVPSPAPPGRMLLVGRARATGSAITGYLRDPAVSAWRKLLGLFVVVYLVWPFDALPDVVPIVGWLDDLGVLSVGAGWYLREIRRWASARRAAASPPGRP